MDIYQRVIVKKFYKMQTSMVKTHKIESKIKKNWLNNSLANLFGGLATAGVNIFIPAIVVNYFDTNSFSAWSLALQISIYVNLMSMGLQTATARAISHEVEKKQNNILSAVTKASQSIAYIFFAFACLITIIITFTYPYVFSNLPQNLINEFQITLAVIGLATATQILAQVNMGVFQGLHRNYIFVAAQVFIRLLTVLVVWLGVEAQQSMAVIAILMAATTILLWPLMQIIFLRFIPWSKEKSDQKVTKKYRNDIFKYCGTLSVWSISMLLVNSAGIVIVGYYDFSAAGAYSLAMTAAIVIVGLIGAALSPLMTTAAALNASKSTQKNIPKLLNKSTLFLSLFLNIFIIFLIIFHEDILKIWVGESRVSSTKILLIILVSAHCLRNIVAPYSLMLLATGLHRRAMISAIIEGFINLISSIFLGLFFGAIGVAIGTMIGAVFGLISSLALNISNTPELTPQPKKFSIQYIIIPLLLFIPIHFYLFTIFL